MGSYAYVAWLCADVDRLTPDDDIPMIKANNIRDVWPRRFARLVAGLRQQIQPRLLVRCCHVGHLCLWCCVSHASVPLHYTRSAFCGLSLHLHGSVIVLVIVPRSTATVAACAAHVSTTHIAHNYLECKIGHLFALVAFCERLGVNLCELSRVQLGYDYMPGGVNRSNQAG